MELEIIHNRRLESFCSGANYYLFSMSGFEKVDPNRLETLLISWLVSDFGGISQLFQYTFSSCDLICLE
jgi:hypothetical protein